METSIYEKLFQGLAALEMLATFPNRDSSRLKYLDSRFLNVCEFFTLYMKSIEPYWRLVEKHISQNRLEVFRKIQALSHIDKAPLTFKEAFRYMISWNIKGYERFFLDVRLPSNIAYKLGCSLEEGNYDEVCKILESFNSSEFLSNIGMMCLLEYGNLEVLDECRPTHLLDVGKYRDFFEIKQKTDQNAINAFNCVMSVICEELGIRDIRLVIHKLTSLGDRRIRIRRGCEVIVVDWPLAKVDSFDINQFFSKDSLATLENRIMSQLELRGHSVSFDYLKKDTIDYLYEILFASINRNFMDIFKVFKVDNDVIISKYKEKLESRSDGYFALTDFNPLEGILVEYFLQIKKSHPILKEIFPKDIVSKLDEFCISGLDSTEKTGKIVADYSGTRDFIDKYFKFETNEAARYFDLTYLAPIAIFISSISCIKDFQILCYLIYPFDCQMKNGVDLIEQHLMGNLCWKNEPVDNVDCANRLYEICNPMVRTIIESGYCDFKKYPQNKLRLFIIEKAKKDDCKWMIRFIEDYWPKPKTSHGRDIREDILREYKSLTEQAKNQKGD